MLTTVINKADGVTVFPFKIFVMADGATDCEHDSIASEPERPSICENPSPACWLTSAPTSS